MNEREALQLQVRLQSHLDYSVAIILWTLSCISLFSVIAVGTLDQVHGGLTMAIQVAPIFLFFPIFATFGMVSDRILVNDLLKNSDFTKPLANRGNQTKLQLNKEDFIRFALIIVLVLISLPWIVARFGLTQILFFQPIHLGEHHGYIGFYMLLSIILISKTEKLYSNSVFKELSVYLLCFLMLWGLGLLLNDFTQEQLGFSFPFVVWGGPDFIRNLLIQIIIVAGLSYIIYYFGWRKYYRKKLSDLNNIS